MKTAEQRRRGGKDQPEGAEEKSGKLEEQSVLVILRNMRERSPPVCAGAVNVSLTTLGLDGPGSLERPSRDNRLRTAPSCGIGFTTELGSRIGS